MSQDKEIIKKLYNVVAKQQKILTKLAQTMGDPNTAKDITNQAQSLLTQITGGKGGFSIAWARGPLSDGTTRVQLQVPRLGHPATVQVIDRLKSKLSELPGFESSRVEVITTTA